MVPGVGGPFYRMRRQVAGYDAGSLPVASTANAMVESRDTHGGSPAKTPSPMGRYGESMKWQRPMTPTLSVEGATGPSCEHGVRNFSLPSDGGRRRPRVTLHCIVPRPRTLRPKYTAIYLLRQVPPAKRDDQYGNGSTCCVGRCPLVTTGAHRSTFSIASAAPFKARWAARAARSGSGLARGPLPRAPGETPPPPGVLRLAASFPTIRDPQRRPPARHPRRQTSARRQAQ